jgi:hypothetical protein
VQWQVLGITYDSHFACSGGKSRYTWIELSQKAGMDPHTLVLAQIGRLMTLYVDASNVRYTSLS